MLHKKVNLAPETPTPVRATLEEPFRQSQGDFQFPSEHGEVDVDIRNGLLNVANERVPVDDSVNLFLETNGRPSPDDVEFDLFLVEELTKFLHNPSNASSVLAPNNLKVSEPEPEPGNLPENMNEKEMFCVDPELLNIPVVSGSPANTTESAQNTLETSVQNNCVPPPTQPLYGTILPTAYPYAPFWFGLMDPNNHPLIAGAPAPFWNAPQQPSNGSNQPDGTQGWQAAPPGWSYVHFPHTGFQQPYFRTASGELVPAEVNPTSESQNLADVDPQNPYFVTQPQQQPQFLPQSQMPPQPQQVQYPYQPQLVAHPASYPQQQEPEEPKQAQTPPTEEPSTPSTQQSYKRKLRVQILTEEEQEQNELRAEMERREKRRRIASAPIFVEGFPNGDVKLPRHVWDNGQEELVRDYPNHLYGAFLRRLVDHGWTARQLADKAGGGGKISRNAMGKRVAKLTGRWKKAD